MRNAHSRADDDDSEKARRLEPDGPEQVSHALAEYSSSADVSIRPEPRDVPDSDFREPAPSVDPSSERLTKRAQVPRWLDQLASDSPDMKAVCYRAGIKLSGLIDWGEGRATFDQEDFAADLRVDARTVRRAFKELSLRRHIEKTERRGNGQWNFYYLTFRR